MVYVGSLTKTAAQSHPRLDLTLGLVLEFAKEGGCVVKQDSVSRGSEAHFYPKITISSEKETLHGQCNYTLWYSAQANHETNLVIVKAKTQHELPGEK